MGQNLLDCGNPDVRLRTHGVCFLATYVIVNARIDGFSGKVCIHTLKARNFIVLASVECDMAFGDSL